jgi:hypothetical protein
MPNRPPFPPERPRRRRGLRARYRPALRRNSHPGEVEWISDKAAEYDFCGSVIEESS